MKLHIISYAANIHPALCKRLPHMKRRLAWCENSIRNPAIPFFSLSIYVIVVVVNLSCKTK